MGELTKGQMDGQMDRQVDGWMDARIDGLTDRWTDRRVAGPSYAFLMGASNRVIKIEKAVRDHGRVTTRTKRQSKCEFYQPIVC